MTQSRYPNLFAMAIRRAQSIHLRALKTMMVTITLNADSADSHDGDDDEDKDKYDDEEEDEDEDEDREKHEDEDGEDGEDEDRDEDKDEKEMSMSKPGRRVAGPFWAQAVNQKRQYLQIRIYKSLHFRPCRSCRKSQKVPTMFFCPARILSNARIVCSDRKLRPFDPKCALADLPVEL